MKFFSEEKEEQMNTSKELAIKIADGLSVAMGVDFVVGKPSARPGYYHIWVESSQKEKNVNDSAKELGGLSISVTQNLVSIQEYKIDKDGKIYPSVAKAESFLDLEWIPKKAKEWFVINMDLFIGNNDREHYNEQSKV